MNGHTWDLRLSSAELLRQLVAHLGPTLVAAMAGVCERKLLQEWIGDGNPNLQLEAAKRLKIAYCVWMMLVGTEGENIARAWFIGANPYLEEAPPYLAIREGEFDGVMAAAAAFVQDAGR